MPTSHPERFAEFDQSTRSRAMYAEVAEAPTSTTDPIYIVVPTFDEGEHQHGPCNWTPRVADDGSVLLPRKGAPCAYVDDEDGDLYIVTWDETGAVVIPGTGGGGGGGGSAAVHQFDQNTAANPWVINHGLGRIPVGMEFFDSGSMEVEPQSVVHTTLNQTTITFSGAMSGKATYI